MTYDIAFMVRRLRLKPRQIYRHIHKRTLPGAIKMEGRWRFDEVVIDLWLDPGLRYGTAKYEALGSDAPGYSMFREVNQTGSYRQRMNALRDFLVLQFRAHRFVKYDQKRARANNLD